MASLSIFASVSAAWTAEENTQGKAVLDLSYGGGDTAVMLAQLGFRVVATDYGPPPPMPNGVTRVGGVDLDAFLSFQSASFDAVDLVEVIEHIENQPQLIREVARVLKLKGVVLISTPNILNLMSRVRFLFTGFLRGRVRPAHYTMLFHYGFAITELRKSRVKFAARFFTCSFCPLIWIFSLIALKGAEKDPIQRGYNWQILSYLFHPALLLSDNIIVKAKKL